LFRYISLECFVESVLVVFFFMPASLFFPMCLFCGDVKGFSSPHERRTRSVLSLVYPGPNSSVRFLIRAFRLSFFFPFLKTFFQEPSPFWVWPSLQIFLIDRPTFFPDPTEPTTLSLLPRPFPSVFFPPPPPEGFLLPLLSNRASENISLFNSSPFCFGLPFPNIYVAASFFSPPDRVTFFFPLSFSPSVGAFSPLERTARVLPSVLRMHRSATPRLDRWPTPPWCIEAFFLFSSEFFSLFVFFLSFRLLLFSPAPFDAPLGPFDCWYFSLASGHYCISLASFLRPFPYLRYFPLVPPPSILLF